jgi:hypothetical protein
MNYTLVDTHIADIRVGDTIEHHGVIKTVCHNNIKHDKFLGITLFGDSYKLGYQSVKKVVVEHARPVNNA